MAESDNTTEASFLGQGWSFPPTFKKGTNQVLMSEGEQDIKESLEILLSTELGERVMRPGYGSSVKPLLFETLDLSLTTLIKEQVELAILYDEPRITVTSFKLEQEELEGTVILYIEYTINATNTRNNIVFPFYLIEGTDLIS